MIKLFLFLLTIAAIVVGILIYSSKESYANIDVLPPLNWDILTQQEGEGEYLIYDPKVHGEYENKNKAVYDFPKDKTNIDSVFGPDNYQRYYAPGYVPNY